VIETVCEMDDLFGGLGVRYAVGGGLALQRYANPRVTVDVDLNVAVPFASAAELVEASKSRSCRRTVPPQSWVPIVYADDCLYASSPL
jgi:hypothetical protein